MFTCESMKRKTITAVSKQYDCSHKFYCYLGGQHRLATSFLMLRFHHSGVPPRVCFVLFKISGQSLEAIACCTVKSADRISISACIWHASPLAAQPPAHSHCRLFQRRFVHCFFTLITHLWTSRSYKTRPSPNTARRGMQAVPLFCKFLCPPLDTAARLDSSSFVLRFRPMNATCCGFETKFVERAFTGTSTPCSTHRSRWGHSILVTRRSLLRPIFKYLRASSQDSTNREATDRQQAGRNHTDTRKRNTTRTHELQRRSQNPKWCSTTKNIPDDTMYIVLEQRLI